MPMPPSRWLRYWPILLVLLGLAVYWPGLHGGFIFDDFPNLVADPDWKVDTLDPAQWRRAMSHGISSSYGRPLAMLSFAANHYFTGMDPFPMKLANLLVHLLNGLLVYLLCAGLFARSKTAWQPPLGRYVAAAVAAAWLVHPLQVSSVLYVVQRMELGAQCCTLLALLAYLKGRSAQIEGRHAWTHFAMAGIATAMGFGFKETVLLVPGYALLIELCVLRFQGKDGRRSRFWIGAYALSCAAALAFFAFVVLPHFSAEREYAFRDFTLVQRLLTQMPVLATYLGHAFWPMPNGLLFYYDNYPISTGFWDPPATAYAAAGLAALLAVAALAWRRWPLTALGIGWFFAAHALTSNVVPLELAFEHRNYLALLGLLIAVAPPLGWLGRRMNTDARRTMALLPIAVLAILCTIQARTWGDPMRLAVALASRNIDSPRASYDLGKLLLESAHKDAQSPQWSMARKEFEHAASLPRSSPLAEQALIIMDARSGRAVPASVWESFRAKLSAKGAGPQEVLALHGVSNCRIQGKCRFDDQELFRTFLVALERNPRSATLHLLYANFSYSVTKDTNLAVRMMREAVRLQPDNLSYQAGLAQYLLASGLHMDHPEVAALVARLKAGNADGRLDEDLRRIRSLGGPKD